MDKYCIVTTTCDDKQNVEKITKALFDNEIASCIQTHNINSTYVWKGNIENADEIILYIKTRKELYKEVETCILDNHSYETPQIVQIPITDGYLDYLNWIDEVTKK